MHLPRRQPSRSLTTGVIILAAALCGANSAEALIVLEGTSAGGTFAITEDITFEITQTGIVTGFRLVDWQSTLDSTQSLALPLVPPTTIQIDLNSVPHTLDFGIFDNNYFNNGDAGPEDGFIAFGNTFGVLVNQGDVMTVFAGSWNWTGLDGQFNLSALGTFDGTITVTDSAGITFGTTNLAPVPEPGTWALVAGIPALFFVGLVRRRRRKQA